MLFIYMQQQSIFHLRKIEKEEPPKRVERSQSEIDREDARRLMAVMAAKNKKEKQGTFLKKRY
jgi:hypothetical protein